VAKIAPSQMRDVELVADKGSRTLRFPAPFRRGAAQKQEAADPSA
jgi:hypothetical protein